MTKARAQKKAAKAEQARQTVDTCQGGKQPAITCGGGPSRHPGKTGKPRDPRTDEPTPALVSNGPSMQAPATATALRHRRAARGGLRKGGERSQATSANGGECEADNPQPGEPDMSEQRGARTDKPRAAKEPRAK